MMIWKEFVTSLKTNHLRKSIYSCIRQVLNLKCVCESFVQERLHEETFSLVLACQLQFYTVKGVAVYCFISSHN